MRYSLTLPLALAALAASPVVAQEGAMPQPGQSAPATAPATPPPAEPTEAAPMDPADPSTPAETLDYACRPDGIAAHRGG